MSRRRSEKKDSELAKESESSNKSEKNEQTHPEGDSSHQDDKSSPQKPATETKIRRPRGRPRKNQNINYIPIPDINHTSSLKPTQSSEHSQTSKKQSTSSPAVTNPEEKNTDKQENSLTNNNTNLINQQSHRAKAGNILYKNIHSSNNSSTNILDTSSPPISKSSSSPTSTSPSYNGFNYIVTHSRLETIETRINDKQIPEMIHPAQSIVYDRLHQESLFLNDKENNKRKNYRVVHTLKRIPACWEPRPWDKSEEKMTKFENLEFTEMIDNFEPLDSEGEIREWYRSKDVRAGTRQKKRVPVMFEVSLINFSTDEFDDQTDFDSY